MKSLIITLLILVLAIPVLAEPTLDEIKQKSKERLEWIVDKLDKIKEKPELETMTLLNGEEIPIKAIMDFYVTMVDKFYYWEKSVIHSDKPEPHFEVHYHRPRSIYDNDKGVCGDIAEIYRTDMVFMGWAFRRDELDPINGHTPYGILWYPPYLERLKREKPTKTYSSDEVV